jgi:hypothetical protein
LVDYRIGIKFEYRNSKQARIIKIKIFQTKP